MDLPVAGLKGLVASPGYVCVSVEVTWGENDTQRTREPQKASVGAAVCVVHSIALGALHTANIAKQSVMGEADADGVCDAAEVVSEPQTTVLKEIPEFCKAPEPSGLQVGLGSLTLADEAVSNDRAVVGNAVKNARARCRAMASKKGPFGSNCTQVCRLAGQFKLNETVRFMELAHKDIGKCESCHRWTERQDELGTTQKEVDSLKAKFDNTKKAYRVTKLDNLKSDCVNLLANWKVVNTSLTDV